MLKTPPSSPYKWTEGGYDVTRSICWSPPGCHGGCGVNLYVKNGLLRRVVGDRNCFFNAGQICIRGRSLPDFIYHPHRITSPLYRKGDRGSGNWKKITYREALDIITERFYTIKEHYGPESVIFCKGTARDIGGYLPRLCYSFGSPNYFGLGPGNGNACYRPRAAVSTAMAGDMIVPHLGQFAHETDEYVPREQCIIVWGANPLISNPDGLHGSWLSNALKHGAKLIVIDPRKTALADKADLFLQISPGSDGALALWLLKKIFAREVLDQDFCAKWVTGSDDLKKRLDEICLESKLNEICHIKTGDIEKALNLITQSQSAALIWGVGIDMHPDCVDTIQSIISILALTGNIEKPGAMLISPQPYGLKRRGDSINDFPHVKQEPIGWKEYPFTAVGNPYGQPDVLLQQLDSGKPYPIKGAFLQGTAVLPSSFAQPYKTAHLLRNIDFIVMVDLFMNPGALALTDLILPAAMWPEKDSIYAHYSQLGAINKAVEPPAQCKSDAEIIFDLGKKLAPQYFPWQTLEGWLDQKLKSTGITFKQLRGFGSLKTEIDYRRHESGRLRRDGMPGFDTPSGKIELSSSLKRNCGLDPLPGYSDLITRLRNEFGFDYYPFILTTGVRRREYFCSEGRIIERLRQQYPQPLVDIHPLDAEKRGINKGDFIKIQTPFGACKMRANVQALYQKGIIHCDYGWSYPEKYNDKDEEFGLKDCNVNYLFPSGQQGNSGFGFPFRCFICNIKKQAE